MSLLTTHLSTQYTHQKILILGFGREGKSTYRVLRTCFPDQTLYVADQKQPPLDQLRDPKLQFDQHYLSGLLDYDVVFKTPGIPVTAPEIQAYLAQGKTLTSQLNEFLEVYRDQVIGVTGTKGKSTTSSLIHHIIVTSGQASLLIGNIGQPVFDGHDVVTAETQIVIEMSSYQLESVKHSPHVAVLLNIFPEHLNYHGSLENYLEAKSHIAAFQTAQDIFIYNQDFPDVVNVAQHTSAQTRPFSTQTANLKQLIGQSPESFTNVSPVVSQNNFLPAVLAAQAVGVSKNQVAAALHSFHPLPHRLQKVGEFRGITFIDDTLATIPEATSLAIQSLPRVDAVLLGGFDRGIDYTQVVDTVVKKKIPVVIFFKPSGEKMYQILQAKYPVKEQPKTFFVDDMQSAIKIVYSEVKPEGVVLLSPASPSFGTFTDYEDKSRQFAQFAQELA